jgi:hypothetical protein
MSVMVVPETTMPPPGVKVWPAMRYSEAEFAEMTEDPIVITWGGTFGPARVELNEPTTTTVCEPPVCISMTVVALSEPRVMGEPGSSVWLDTMNTEDESGVRAMPPTTTAVGELDLVLGTAAGDDGLGGNTSGVREIELSGEGISPTAARDVDVLSVGPLTVEAVVVVVVGLAEGGAFCASGAAMA